MPDAAEGMFVVAAVLKRPAVMHHGFLKIFRTEQGIGRNDLLLVCLFGL